MDSANEAYSTLFKAKKVNVRKSVRKCVRLKTKAHFRVPRKIDATYPWSIIHKKNGTRAPLAPSEQLRAYSGCKSATLNLGVFSIQTRISVKSSGWSFFQVFFIGWLWQFEFTLHLQPRESQTYLTVQSIFFFLGWTYAHAPVLISLLKSLRS